MLDKNAMDRIKEVMRKAVDINYVAGANLLVIKDGNEIFYNQEGYADIEAGLPIKRDSIFRLYSMSKPVTSAAVMILLERGEIDLCDPVGEYLEGFKDQKFEQEGRLVPVISEMTIKDLLSMTSGLVYGGDNKAGKGTEEVFRVIDKRLLGDSPMGTVEAMNMLGRCTLAFQPGSSWQYGTSADVLGALVEVVSKKRFGQFLRDEIFEPLKMDDMGFWVPEEKRKRLVTAYAGKGGKLTPYFENHLGIINSMDRDPAFESGGAGLVSTIDDYAKFARMLINGGSLGKARILRPETVKYMTSATLSAAQQKVFDLWPNLCGYSYGNLMRVMTDTGRANFLVSPGEYGWDGWLGAYFCNCPNDGLTFLFMMQKTDSGTTALARKLRNIVLSSL